MELTRFRPYTFTSLSPIISMYIYDCMALINRIVFTEEQYLTRSIPLTWSNLRRCLFKTLYHWTIIIFLTLSIFAQNHFSFLQPFHVLYERTLHLSKIDLFLTTYLLTFVICEYTCVYATVTALTYVDTRWNICYEMRATVDRKLSGPTKRMLIRYFIRNSTLAGLVNKSNALGMVTFVGKIAIDGLVMLLEGQMNLIDLLLGLWMTLSLNYILFDAIYLSVTCFTGLFFMIRLFQVELSSCMEIVKRFSRKRITWQFTRFHYKYIHLHRQMLGFNRTIREYIFTIDVASKTATSLTLLYIFKQPILTLYSILFIFLYLIVYSYDMYLHLKLSWFQTQNTRFYRRLNQATTSSMKGMRAPSQMKYAYMIEFVGSHNQLGFSLGRQYQIDRQQVVQSFAYNLFMLSLLWDKIGWE